MQTFLDTKIASDQAARRQEQLPRLCGETAAIVRRAWGRGPVKTTAHWAGPNILVVMLELGLTDAETTLRATGHTEQLLAGRQLLDQIIQDELTCSVERITGRDAATVACRFRARLLPDAAHRKRNWWPISCRGSMRARRLRDRRLEGSPRAYVCRSVRP